MNTKKYFYCQSKNVQKYGKIKGEQRYKYTHCGKLFIGEMRIDNDLLWYEYEYRKQTLIQLAKTYKCSSKTIQRRIKKHQTTHQDKSEKPIILLLDTTYWKRAFGMMLFKDAITGNNLLKCYVKNETNTLYLNGIRELEQRLETWKEYYEERSGNPKTGAAHYTHKQLRSAFRSLNNNHSYLFTYQKVPELPISNTSNMIEGCFGNLKQ